MKNLLKKTRIIAFLFLLIIGLAGSVAAWPSLTITSYPSTVTEDDLIEIEYTATSDTEELMQVKFKDLDAGTSLVHGALFTYIYTEIEKVTKSTAGTYSFEIEVMDVKGTTYTDRITLEVIVDTIPPGPVTNLRAVAKTNETITWAWNNPIDHDFDFAIVYIDGINIANVSDGTFQLTGLEELTSYTIGIETSDKKGNINTEIVEDTVETYPTNDVIPPGIVTNLIVASKTNESIRWEWQNPDDLDLDKIEVYIDDIHIEDVATYYYELTGLTAGTSYKIGLRTVDINGNINPTFVENTAITNTNPDLIPPGTVTGLTASQVLLDRITWSWTNPADADFSHVIVYIDDVYAGEVTGNSYQATGFSANSQHKIGLQTADLSGNINESIVENIQTTLAHTEPGFTLTEVEFVTVNAGSVQAVLTITNTGTEELTSVQVGTEISAEYSASVTGAGSIAIGAGRDITITINVPKTDDSNKWKLGTKTIGKINVTANDLFKQTDAKLTIEDSLGISQIKIKGITNAKDASGIEDETDFSYSVKPKSIFQIEMKLENMNLELDLTEITVTGTIKRINDGEDIEQETTITKINSESTKDASLRFEIPALVRDGRSYSVKLLAEGEDEFGNTHKAEFEFEVNVEKALRDFKVLSLSLAKNDLLCTVESTTLTVKAINAGLRAQTGVIISVFNTDLELNEETAVDFSETENEEQTVSFKIEIPNRLANMDVSYPIMVKITNNGLVVDSTEIALNTKECERPSILIDEEPDEDVSVQFLNTQSETGFIEETKEKTGTSRSLSDMMDSMNLSNELLTIGGISIGVILVALTAGFIINKKKTEMLF